MSSLYIHFEHPQHEIASSLRKIFSGIVSGNIKEEGVLFIEKNDPFQITGDHKIMHEKWMFSFRHFGESTYKTFQRHSI